MLDFVYLETKNFPLVIEAKLNKLEEVLTLLKNDMIKHHVSADGQFNMITAAEEIFANIASYAYENEEGTVEIKTSCQNNIYSVCFKDRVKKYNPLKNQDPDTTTAYKDRDIGGLGVFLAKKVSDQISYRYQNGWNILTVGVQVNK